MRDWWTGKSQLRLLSSVLVAALQLGCAGSDETASGDGEAAASVGETQAVVGELLDRDPPAGQLLRVGTEAWLELAVDKGTRTGDLDMMTERRAIRALVVPSLTNYFLDGPIQRGITYEGFKTFEEWLNKELGSPTLKLHVVMIPTTRDLLFEQLAAGYGDIGAGNLTITRDRQQLVDFADPFLPDVREVLVTGPSAPALSSLEDLAGLEVYVRASSSYYQSLEELNTRFRDDGIEPMTLSPAEEYLEDEHLLEMVGNGTLPFAVVDEHKAEFWSQIYEGLTVRADLAFRTEGEIAWAFRENSPQLAELLSRFVAEHKKGTLLGNMVLNRYLKDTSRVRSVMSDEGRQAYAQTVAFFQEHAPSYGFDYLMMVAQGYQESRLDQSLRSHRGAVGIMQLLPSTARDKAVDIPNIEEADRNVEAGIRYMRWIRDTYFADDQMDDVNKTLFSFASYNAGPNRIARLREEARERGLDPNVWFNQVELVVAEKIGRETVNYVANIYKSYAAFRLLDSRDRPPAE